MLSALLVQACAAKQKGPESPAPGERWIASIHLEGNTSFSKDSIIDGLVSNPPSGILVRKRVRYDPALVAIDSRRIETFYQQRGFLDARVLDVRSKERKGLGNDITFVISEGEASHVTALEIDGLSKDEQRAMIAKLGIKIGERFDYERYDQGKLLIINTLREAGHAHAKLTATANANRRTREVILRYEIDPGPVVRIGKISVKGLSTMPESVVRNRLSFAEGDTFSPRPIAESSDRLRALGRFSVARIDFADDTRSEVSDISVTVSEGPAHELRLGGGTAFDGGLSLDNAQWLIRARAGYTRLGFLDPLTTLDSELQPGFAVQTGGSVGPTFVGEAKVGLAREDLFWPLMTGSTALSYNVLAFDNFKSHGPRIEVGAKRPFWHERIKLGASWQGELLCFTDRPAILDPGPAGAGVYDAATAEQLGIDHSCTSLAIPRPSSYRLAFAEESVALEGRDSVIDTRRGYYIEARFEQSASVLGSEFSYLTVTPEARAYWPLGSRIVLAGRLRYGRTLAGELPLTRRYFSGGASSHRGFGQRQLAPVVGDLETSRVEIGGDELLESSIEARFDLFKLWDNLLGLVVFTDAADVSLRSGGIDPGNLHIAPGLGLRYHTPIGPFRFDMGYRATRRGSGEIHASDSLAWHLSIGEAF